MRRTLIAMSLVGSSAFAGCAQENPGFFVQNAAALDESCMFTTSSPSMSSGMFDVGFSRDVDGTRQPIRPYTLNLVMRSNLVSRDQGVRSAPRPDSAAVNIEGAEVRIYGGPVGTDTHELIADWAEFTIAAAGNIPSAVSGSPGRGVVTLETIGYQVGRRLADKYMEAPPTQIVIGVRVFGKTVGGHSVETDEWYWPLTVCDGCLRVSGPIEDSCTPGQNGFVWTEELRLAASGLL